MVLWLSDKAELGLCWRFVASGTLSGLRRKDRLTLPRGRSMASFTAGHFFTSVCCARYLDGPSDRGRIRSFNIHEDDEASLNATAEKCLRWRNPRLRRQKARALATRISPNVVGPVQSPYSRKLPSVHVQGRALLIWSPNARKWWRLCEITRFTAARVILGIRAKFGFNEINDL